MKTGYDLAGDVTSWTHPWPFTITQTVNAAQQITAISNSYYDAAHPQNIAQNITYTPFGAPSQIPHGCAGSGCVDAQYNWQYTKNLEP